MKCMMQSGSKFKTKQVRSNQREEKQALAGQVPCKAICRIADKQGGPIDKRKQACQEKVEISEKPNSL